MFPTAPEFSGGVSGCSSEQRFYPPHRICTDRGKSKKRQESGRSLKSPELQGFLALQRFPVPGKQPETAADANGRSAPIWTNTMSDKEFYIWQRKSSSWVHTALWCPSWTSWHGTTDRAASKPRHGITKHSSGSARFWRTSFTFSSCPTSAASIWSAMCCTYRETTLLPAPSRPIWRPSAFSTIR